MWMRAIVIESSKSEYWIIRLSDIRISAKSYIRVGPYYPKPILEQRIIGSIFEHERIYTNIGVHAYSGAFFL